MRKCERVFPEKFDDAIEDEEAPELQTGNVVAPVERSGKKPRTVRLTSTQVEPRKTTWSQSKEQYAAQLMKDHKEMADREPRDTQNVKRRFRRRKRGKDLRCCQHLLQEKVLSFVG